MQKEETDGTARRKCMKWQQIQNEDRHMNVQVGKQDKSNMDMPVMGHNETLLSLKSK